jgi:hypothetical protein
MREKRVVFYPILTGIFLVFFLLHWNGFLSATYFWALVLVHGTNSFLPQVTAAFLSAVVIFSVPVALFEWNLRLANKRELQSSEYIKSLRSGRFPVGMIILCVYMGMLILSNLAGLSIPSMMIGPFVLGKIAVIIEASLSVLMLAISLFGILRKKIWTTTTILVWFGFRIFYKLLGLVLIFINKAETFRFYGILDDKTLMLNFLTSTGPGLIINIVICWYVYSRRDFFAAPVDA